MVLCSLLPRGSDSIEEAKERDLGQLGGRGGSCRGREKNRIDEQMNRCGERRMIADYAEPRGCLYQRAIHPGDEGLGKGRRRAGDCGF
jgi:hypothetical protein